MSIEIVAKFELEEADSHRLPAYDGAQSILGIARALVLTTHYAATGTIRQRAPFESGIEVFIEPPRKGSLEAIFQVVADPAVQIIGGVAVGAAGNFIYDMAKLVFSRSVGIAANPKTQALKKIDSEHSGDIDALVDAVDPTLKLGHKAINNGANTIVIIQGDNNIVSFNQSTKEYVEKSNVSKSTETQDVSIGSYNVNSGYGRAYFYDLGKTVPFTIQKTAERGTIGAISHSLDCYANNRPSDISIKFFRITASDGRTKNIVITGASKIKREA